MLENSDIENILSKPDRLEFLLNLDKNNYIDIRVILQNSPLIKSFKMWQK